MAQGKPIGHDAPIGPIEQAITERDYTKARRYMAIKLARMMDATDSARDVKSLALTLDTTIDKCEGDDRRIESESTTPYAQILREAEEALANG